MSSYYERFAVSRVPTARRAVRSMPVAANLNRFGLVPLVVRRVVTRKVYDKMVQTGASRAALAVAVGGAMVAARLPAPVRAPLLRAALPELLNLLTATAWDVLPEVILPTRRGQYLDAGYQHPVITYVAPINVDLMEATGWVRANYDWLNSAHYAAGNAYQYGAAGPYDWLHPHFPDPTKVGKVLMQTVTQAVFLMQKPFSGDPSQGVTQDRYTKGFLTAPVSYQLPDNGYVSMSYVAPPVTRVVTAQQVSSASVVPRVYPASWVSNYAEDPEVVMPEEWQSLKGNELPALDVVYDRRGPSAPGAKPAVRDRAGFSQVSFAKHVLARPRTPIKERKVKIVQKALGPYTVAMGFYGRFTEFRDAVKAIYKTLPRQFKVKMPKRFVSDGTFAVYRMRGEIRYGANGRWLPEVTKRTPTTSEMLKALYTHWGAIDAPVAAKNLFLQEIEDMAIAYRGKQINKLTQPFLGRYAPVGVQFRGGALLAGKSLDREIRSAYDLVK